MKKTKKVKAIKTKVKQVSPRVRTKYLGVYSRPSADRTTPNGKPDICFDIAYRANGKLVWEKIGWLSEGYSPKTAEQVRANRIQDIRHGRELPRQRKHPLFKEAAKKYLEWAETDKKSWKKDQERYNNYLAARFDDKRLDQICSLDLERLKLELTKAKLAPATVKHGLVLVRQIYNKAICWELYKGTNPIKGVKLPVLSNERMRFLTQDEAKTLFDVLKESYPQLYVMSLIALYCGFRASEIFSLEVSDLDFENCLISVRDSKNKSSRKAYMIGVVKEALEAIVGDRKKGYVFPNSEGDKYNEISKKYHAIITQLKFNEGIKDRRQLVTFHTLRHSFASWLAMQGESLLTIGELMGHKSMVMTKRYSHLSPDHKRRAVELLEKNFSQKTAEQAQG